MKKFFLIATMTMAVIGFDGCVNVQKAELERKVASEDPILKQRDLRERVKGYIASSEDLSDEQKKDLNELFTHSWAEADDLRQQSLKLESVLVQDILATDYNNVEVSLIKTQLTKLNNKVLDLRANTLFSANKIVGHSNAHRDFLDDAYHFGY
ncbi:MAG: hypothetical protein ACXWQQ_11665 [Pseudobdellovibrio sp.]